jgi:hypothetical protein
MDRGVYPLLDHRQWLGRTAVKNKGADLQLDGDSDWTLPIFEFNEWIFLYFLVKNVLHILEKAVYL